jgi:hypothetical protein
VHQVIATYNDSYFGTTVTRRATTRRATTCRF